MNSSEVPYWHLWVDESGVTRQERRALTASSEADWHGVGEVLTTGKIADVTEREMLVLPPGTVYEWHENPFPQWIVPLSGQWFVESTDGRRVEMGPGEISFGEDQNSLEIDGKRGHLSGVVGDEPCILLCIRASSKAPEV